MMNSLAEVTNSFPQQQAVYYAPILFVSVCLILLHVGCGDAFMAPGAPNVSICSPDTLKKRQMRKVGIG